MDLEPKILVFIAIMNNGRVLHIANTEHWYRIPVKSAPKRLEDTSYLAFYLTKAFGDQKWSIPYWANIRKKKIVKRLEILPLESDHPRANEEYYKIEIDDLKQLSVPIICRRGRRITFITTTVEKFKSAKEINDLFDESPLEDKLWDEFKKGGIYAERQFPIIEKKNAQVLSVAGGKVQIMDLETYESAEATIDPEIKEQLQPNWTVIYWDIMGVKIIKAIKSKE
jgi:hypothetical protein